MKEQLKKLSLGVALSEEETFLLFRQFVALSPPTDAQIGAYMFATADRLLSSAELVGAARAMREVMVPLNVPNAGQLLDTCGTGGSGLNAFNTSTVVALVVAAAGQKVVKHGNRASSSKSGSADVLQALGVRIDLSEQELLQCLEQTNFAFLFAPKHHPATKHVAKIRSELGVRTIFNYLGPLLNPARPQFQLLGVSSQAMVPILGEALRQLGLRQGEVRQGEIQRAMVVCGQDGLDEITLTGKTVVCEVRDGALSNYLFDPAEHGLSLHPPQVLQGGTPEETAAMTRRILAGEKCPLRDLVVLNAAAALRIAGLVKDIKQGIIHAGELIDSGKAAQTLDRLSKF